MKIVVALLLAANVLLLAAAQGWLGAENWRRVHPNHGDPARMALEVAPQAITVIAPERKADAGADVAGDASAAAGKGANAALANANANVSGKGDAAMASLAAAGQTAANAMPASDASGASAAGVGSNGAPTAAPAATPAAATSTTAAPAAASPAAPTAGAPNTAASTVAANQSPAAPAAPAQTPPPARLACLEFGPLASDDATRLAARLHGDQPALKLVTRTQPETTTWLVHLPPQADKAGLDHVTADLRLHGIEDFYVLQDPPTLRNAVSLGLFRSAEGANTQAAQLAARGVKGIKVTARPSAAALGFVEVRDLPAPGQTALDRAARDWPTQRWHGCAAAVAAR